MVVAVLPVLASAVPPAAASYTLWLTVYFAEQYKVMPGLSVAIVPAPLLLQSNVPQVLSEASIMLLARWLPVLEMLMLTVTSVPAAQQQKGMPSSASCRARYALADTCETPTNVDMPDILISALCSTDTTTRSCFAFKH
jgi:hypothetical protein